MKNIKIYLYGILSFLAFITLPVTATSDIPLMGLQIRSETNRLKVGEELQIQTIFTPSNTTEREVFFTTTNKEILSVDPLGKVKGLADGKAVVYASVPGRKQRLKLTFRVGYPVETIVLDLDSKTIGVGNSTLVKANILPIKAKHSPLKWSVSDDNVAQISQNGELIAKKKGEVTVRVQTLDGTVKTQQKIKVIQSFFKPNLYEVGKSIPAGEYKIFNAGNDARGNWSLFKDENQKSLLDQNIFGSFDYIRVEDGQFILLKNAYAIPIDIAPKYNGEEYYDSKFKLGFDLPIGQYKIQNNNSTKDSYWAVLKHPSASENIRKFGILSGQSDLSVSTATHDNEYLELYNCIVELDEE
ncbi:MAG: Ig-like domain-containing protein [Streptococcaceae bacterium]|jgi:hypothetical protein|nr:Ig-like domain-containing protein [Streptococcaceae bacterium]